MRRAEVRIKKGVSLHSGVCDLRLIEPLGYLDYLALQSHAALVLTDSGGTQEETTILGVPCLTLRQNMERPITVTHGTNRVIGTDPRMIAVEVFQALQSPPRPSAPPPLWDGQAARRIMKILAACCEHQTPTQSPSLPKGQGFLAWRVTG